MRLIHIILAAFFVYSSITLADDEPTLILIKNVNIFDGKNTKLKMGYDVLVENNLIKQLGKGLKAGDVQLIGGNPLEDVTILSDPDNNLKMIMKDGVIYKNTL